MQKILCLIFCSSVSISLFSMQQVEVKKEKGMETSAAALSSSPPPQYHTATDNAIRLSAGIAAKFSRPLARKIAEELDDAHPTNVFFRATLAKTPKERRALLLQAALTNPGRPSATKKELIHENYDLAKQKARIAWNNIYSFRIQAIEELGKIGYEDLTEALVKAKATLQDLDEIMPKDGGVRFQILPIAPEVEATYKASLGERRIKAQLAIEKIPLIQKEHERLLEESLNNQRTYEEEFNRAQIFYKEMLRDQSLEENKPMSENELEHKTAIKFAHRKFKWDLVSAKAFWERAKKEGIASKPYDLFTDQMSKHLNSATRFYENWLKLYEPTLTEEQLKAKAYVGFQMLRQKMLTGEKAP